MIWLRQAEEELARIWLEAERREQITDAAQRIDSLLTSDPGNVGESRASDRRILYVSPLGIIYRVVSDDMQVRVLRVWYHTKKE